MTLPTLNSLPTGMDLDDYRYPAEKRKLDRILDDPQAIEMLEGLTEEDHHDPRTYNLLSGVRLTRNMCPRIFETLDEVVRLLGYPMELEIYVHQSPIINASITMTFLDETKPIVMLTSGMIEKMSPAEMLFVLGHEMGHFLFEHQKYSVPNLMQRPESREYPYQSVQLMSWYRACEITADRIGMLCCQSFATAIKAFFKLSSGLSDEHIQADLKAYWQQIKEARDVVFGEGDQLGSYSTHPFSPYRAKALHRFWCWEDLNELWHGPKPSTQFDRKQMEMQVNALIADMDPDYLKSNKAAESRIDEFFAWAGGMVIAADGVLDKREIVRLRGFIGEEMTTKILKTLRSNNGFDKAAEKCLELSAPVQGKASRQALEQMLVNLVALSAADGEIDESEVVMIANLCDLMGLHRAVLARVLRNYSEPPKRGRRSGRRRRR